MNYEKTKKFLKDNNFIASKKLGQNFLVDQNKVFEIIDNIPNLENFDLIVEIGPGLGAITQHLIHVKKQIVAIELDKRLYSFLKEKYKNEKNLILVNDDFLDFDLTKISAENQRVIVIANIPYSIASKIVMKCISYNLIQALYIMVQKEFAERFDFSKKTNRNAFTIFASHYYNFKFCFSIPGKSFNPIPKVDSSMIIFNRKNQNQYDGEYLKFLRMIFLMKRKTLLNNIVNKQNKILMEAILKDNDINKMIRAEELDDKTLYEIYLAYKSKGK